MDLRQLSQVNFGLILNSRVPASLYRPEWFARPYDDGVKILLEKGATKEDVAKVVSSDYLNDAHDAVHKWNGIGDMENFDWVKALKDAAWSVDAGKKLQKVGKKLEANEEVDLLSVYGELTSYVARESSGLTLGSEIEYGTYKPFKKSGYAPIDKTLGGIPSDGPIVIYGLTGVGKSTVATSIINGLLHQYPQETAAIYTLEMNKEHWLWRTTNLFPTIKEVLDRLYVSGSVKDVEELVAEITAKKVNYVVIDDMDNLVKSSDASEYERIYRRVKEICRFMGIPVFVLGQPNRNAKFEVSSGNRFLGPYDVAWSGAAENSAALQIAIQTTNGLDMKSEEFPTTDEDMNYLLFWKSRDGWPADRDPQGKGQRGPGAVIMEKSPTWNGAPYGGKWRIHSPVSGSNKIGKRKEK